MVDISLHPVYFPLQMFLFLVLVYILNLFIYKPVLRIMRERANRVASMEGEAEKAEAGIEESLAEYKRKLGEAREKGMAERVALRKTGAEKETEIVGTAHEEANRKIEESRASIASEKEKALAALRGMAGEMGQEIADKALRGAN